MQPLSNAAKERILKQNPNVTPEMIEEYEKLRADSLSHKPEQFQSRDEMIENKGREERLGELSRLLFPS